MQSAGPARDMPHEPTFDCQLCERLVAFRGENRVAYPDWFNSPVPTFGGADCALLIVGLAPGLKGANRTGRPFTGDYAGDLLYPTLIKYGFANGAYGAHADDGLQLIDCAISNAVRCVPPKNKPTSEEIRTCRSFLSAQIHGLSNLKAILVLGRIAHNSTIAALDLRQKDYPFSHGRRHNTSADLVIFDSFHCSRYNTNTGRLTEEMFFSVFENISCYLKNET